MIRNGCSPEAPSANLLFMAAVGLVYAPLAPLVALAAAVVFWISSVVYKYQLMFVFVSKVESGGVSEPYWGVKCFFSSFLSAPLEHRLQPSTCLPHFHAIDDNL